MWSIFGLLLLYFVVSPIGQKIVGTALTPHPQATIIQETR
jgi:hypothetical protein